MKTGIELIAEERKRQIEQLGWDAEHDAKHTRHELARAAACYATPGYLRTIINGRPFGWPFNKHWWKPSPQDRKRELVKAGALIAAEIDRLQMGNEKDAACERKPIEFEHRILGRVDISSCCD